ncbi:MAG: hypothetical protein AB7H66_07520 [Hyphomonadaceae bacterium]
MRTFLLTTAVVALLAACTPPAQQERPETPPGPQVVACNDVAPDASRQIGVEDAVAAAAAASELRGGAITPGTYDLVRAARIGAATGWDGTRAVALAVSEDASGAVTFNWAGAAPGGETDRWTATFNDSGAHPIVSYTCGRMGDVAAEFAATQTSLQLRLPDGANGQLSMDFERRR